MAQLMHYHCSDSFSSTQIAGIDSSGILFADGQSIFFEECARNFARAYPAANTTCIAERDILAQPPYIEFYTCGKSMIVRFDEPGKRAHKAFRELCRSLERFGYTTYDLS